MKKIAVIGSAGFIAGYVIEELHKQGHYVIGLQRHEPLLVKRENKDLEYGDIRVTINKGHGDDMFDSQSPDETYFGDITNAEAVSRVVSISDGVINLAGRLGTSEEVSNPYPAVEINIKGTLNVLDACKTWKKPFVQIAVGNHWMDNTYSITRTTAERFTRMYANEFGVEANVVRALNAYGPRQSYFSYKKIIPSFILSALHNKPLMVNGDGEQVMDMIYVADLAKFLVLTLLDPAMAYESSLTATQYNSAVQLLPNKIFGQTYQCGEGDGLTVNQIAELIIKLSESTSEIQHREMRAGEPEHARIVSDYKSPTYEVTLEEGLKKTIEYFRANLNRYTI